MDFPQALIDNVGGLGLLAIAAWLIWRQYRQDKTGIDAATDQTAIALLAQMGEELSRVRERVAVLEEANRGHEEYRQRHVAVLQTHAGWDSRAVAAIPPDALAVLGEPTPLYPQGG